MLLLLYVLDKCRNINADRGYTSVTSFLSFLPPTISMPHSPDVDGWIQAAKLATSAGEMAPFPFIKGAAGCVTIVLEAIEVRSVDCCCTACSQTKVLESWKERRGPSNTGRGY